MKTTNPADVGSHFNTTGVPMSTFATVALVVVLVAAVLYYLGPAFLVAWVVGSVALAVLWSAYRQAGSADAEEVRIDEVALKQRINAELLREARDVRLDRRSRGNRTA